MTEKQMLTMDEVRIQKDKLLQTIEKNREVHEKEYNETVEAYKILVKEKLKEKIEQQKIAFKKSIKELEENMLQFENDVNVKPLVSVQKPVNYLENYDTAIGMLNYSIDDIVCLHRKEFQSYVMDNWSWKEEFRSTNSAITSGSASYLKS